MIRREGSPRSDFTLIYNNSTISAIVVYIIDFFFNCLICLYLYNQAKQLYDFFFYTMYINGHYTNLFNFKIDSGKCIN